jgi:hypothetical protein
MESWTVGTFRLTALLRYPNTPPMNFFPKRLAVSSMECYLDIHLDFGKNLLRCPPSADEKLLEGLMSIQSRRGARNPQGQK